MKMEFAVLLVRTFAAQTPRNADLPSSNDLISRLLHVLGFGNAAGIAMTRNCVRPGFIGCFDAV